MYNWTRRKGRASSVRLDRQNVLGEPPWLEERDRDRDRARDRRRKNIVLLYAFCIITSQHGWDCGGGLEVPISIGFFLIVESILNSAKYSVSMALSRALSLSLSPSANIPSDISRGPRDVSLLSFFFLFFRILYIVCRNGSRIFKQIQNFCNSVKPCIRLIYKSYVGCFDVVGVKYVSADFQSHSLHITMRV